MILTVEIFDRKKQATPRYYIGFIFYKKYKFFFDKKDFLKFKKMIYDKRFCLLYRCDKYLDIAFIAKILLKNNNKIIVHNLNNNRVYFI